MTNKKRNIYLAVIGLGLVGVVIDRLAGSAKPAAAMAAPERQRKAGTAAVTLGEVTLAVTVAPFPDASRQGADVEGVRDPFAPAEAALARLREAAHPIPPEVTPAAPAVVEAVAARQTFAEQHVLSAVVRFGDEPVAVIDGLSMSMGQSIDDCTLIEVRTRSVVFACLGGDVALSLEGAARSGAQGGAGD